MDDQRTDRAGSPGLAMIIASVYFVIPNWVVLLAIVVLLLVVSAVIARRK
jgi:hypothetical protein